jgi:hypothetical protein
MAKFQEGIMTFDVLSFVGMRRLGSRIEQTSRDLASQVPGKGLDLIAQPTVAQLMASSVGPRGAGSSWNAGGYEYTEAALVATDHDLMTAGGVKLYVPTNRPLRLDMFGAVGDGATDNQAAVTLFNAAVARRIRLVATGASSFGYASSPLDIDLSGRWAFSNTMIIWPGANYRLPGGALLTALTLGQTMLRTPTPAEVVTNLGGVYGSFAPKLAGGGTVDGANKASIGVLADTVTDGAYFDVSIVRCSGRRYSTTVTGTSASATITVPGSTDIRVNDVVHIPAATKEFFFVKSVSGTTVTLDRVLGANLTATPAVHRACGFVGAALQQSELRLTCQRNDVSWAFGRNVDGVQCTDVKIFGGKTEFSNIGEVIVAGDIHHYGCTIMHSFESESVSCDGVGTTYIDLYVETMSDAQANTLIPPVQTGALGATTVRSKPAIRVLGGRLHFTNINWPTNPQTTGFRRLMYVAGDVVVDGVIGSSVDLLVNPLIANDYGIVEKPAGGTCVLEGVRGFTNLASANVGSKLVVLSDGTLPASYEWSVTYSGSTRWASVLSGAKQIFGQVSSTATSLLDFFRVGEAYPRLSLTAGAVYLGTGAAAPTDNINLNSIGRFQTSSAFRILGGFGMTPLTAAPASPFTGHAFLCDQVTWDPLARGSGGAYWVWWTGTAWRGMHEDASGGNLA